MDVPNALVRGTIDSGSPPTSHTPVIVTISGRINVLTIMRRQSGNISAAARALYRIAEVTDGLYSDADLSGLADNCRADSTRNGKNNRELWQVELHSGDILLVMMDLRLSPGGDMLAGDNCQTV